MRPSGRRPTSWASRRRSPGRSERPPDGTHERFEVHALEDRRARRRVESEHAVPGVPAEARLGEEPHDALDALGDGAQEIGARRPAVVARVAEHEHKRRTGQDLPPLPEIDQHPSEVGARVQVERPFGGDVATFDRDRDETVDVGEEMDATEVAPGRRQEPETEVARRRDRSGEIAERDEIGPARSSPAPAWADGHPAGREGGTDGPPEVETAAARLPLPAREPTAKPRAELAHERACLLDVTRGELREGEREEAARADRTAAPVACLIACPRWLAEPRDARPRSLALPFPASRPGGHPVPTRHP